MVDNARVNYLCQRCQQPLRLDSSLLSLDEHTLAELSLPITPIHHHQLLSQVYLPITPTPTHHYHLLSQVSLPITPTPTHHHQLRSQVYLPFSPTHTHHHQLLSQVYLPIPPTHHLYSLGSSIGGHVSPLLVFLITASTSTPECCRPASMRPAVMGSCFSFVLLYTGRLTGPPGAAGPPQ